MKPDDLKASKPIPDPSSATLTIPPATNDQDKHYRSKKLRATMVAATVEPFINANAILSRVNRNFGRPDVSSSPFKAFKTPGVGSLILGNLAYKWTLLPSCQLASLQLPKGGAKEAAAYAALGAGLAPIPHLATLYGNIKLEAHSRGSRLSHIEAMRALMRGRYFTRGLSAAMLRDGFYSMGFFLAPIYQARLPSGLKDPHPTISTMISGAAAGATMAVLSQPAEAASGIVHRKLSLVAALREIKATQGHSGIFRSLPARLKRIGIGTAVILGITNAIAPDQSC